MRVILHKFLFSASKSIKHKNTFARSVMTASGHSNPEPPSKKLKVAQVQPKPDTMVTDKVTLLPVEQLLRRLLIECRNDLPSDEPSSKLVLRFTGGWVRDKLLGIQSHDIDVGLSTMTGMQFGEALQRFVSKRDAEFETEAEKLSVPGSLKGLHQIAANPEKSKHLETVTTKIFGLDVDLVNLRKETYTEESRNPQMEFGTPYEDALRRDATVNALFYNLDTEEVEDFTGKGLDDMEHGIMRTPLEPHQTFMDDPLRVLRLIRFASKLGYKIDLEAELGMQNREIHAALNAKISRERVGVEVLKMINGPDPLMAFDLIHRFDLYATVFLNPSHTARASLQDILPTIQGVNAWPLTWPRAYQSLQILLGDDSTHISTHAMTLFTSDAEAEICWLLAAYAPLLKLGQDAVLNAREAIKATNKVSKILGDAVMHQGDISLMVDRVAETNGHERSIPRSDLGMAIRSWGSTWKLQVLYSFMAEVVLGRSEEVSLTDDSSTEHLLCDKFARYDKFAVAVQKRDLENAATVQPHINGNDIRQAFELQKSGPWMKGAIDGVMKWQFDHPKSSKDEAREWLLTQRAELGIP